MEQPPTNTRAYGRSELVKYLLTAGTSLEPDHAQSDERFFPAYVINWSIFQVRGRAPFPMPDPFKTYAPDVRAHLQTV